jgi:hypothetical protein
MNSIVRHRGGGDSQPQLALKVDVLSGQNFVTIVGARYLPSCWSCVWDAERFRRSAAASYGDGVASGGCAVSGARSSIAAAGSSPSACSDFCFAVLPADGSRH